MFFHEAKQILRKFLLLRPRSLNSSKKGLFTLQSLRQLRAGAELDAFQRAVIVFTIVLCHRRRRRRPRERRFWREFFT